jgi:hypothetical protein
MLFVWQTTPRGGTGHFWLDLILGSMCFLGLMVVFRIDYRAAFIFTVLLTALISDFAGSGSGTGGVLGAVAFSVTMGLADHPSDFSSGFAGVAFTVGIAATLLLITIGRVAQRATSRGWRGAFLSFFLPAMILTCLADATLLSSFEAWEEIGPTLLFIGLLTLLNAPFDWFSLGLTRALLRRGLELGGWWPYALALVDACLAAVIIAGLALTMVVGVQAFDALAEHGGGKPVLSLDPLLTGIAAHPSVPEYCGSTRSCFRP